MENSLQELGEALVHDSLNDLAVDVSKPDTHHRADDEQDVENVDVTRLTRIPTRQDNLD